MDPRRPHNAQNEESPGKPTRSYGQSAEAPKRGQDEIEDFEDLTDEPVREGDDTASDNSGAVRTRKKREMREFEDLAGEPVLDEDTDEKNKS
jgi:hypothetical protein